MKTVTLSPNDEIELGILRQALEVEVLKQRAKINAIALRRYMAKRKNMREDDDFPLWSPTTNEAEYNAVKALAVINRILK